MLEGREQFHLSHPGFLYNSDKYPLLVMNIFVGGMNQFIQKIRKIKAWLFSILLSVNYLSGGMFSVYASMKPEQHEKVLGIILEEIYAMKENCFTEEEFTNAKEQLKGNYILGNETTGSRMSAIGKAKTIFNKVLSPMAIINMIDSVKPEDVTAVIKKTFQPEKICASLVGNEDKTDRIWDLLKRGI